jgi:hypothetical protein
MKENMDPYWTENSASNYADTLDDNPIGVETCD